MIWGETWEQRKARLEAPSRVYAWRPRRLDDGRWVWLTYYHRKWWEDPNPTWAGDSSRWQRYV